MKKYIRKNLKLLILATIFSTLAAIFAGRVQFLKGNILDFALARNLDSTLEYINESSNLPFFAMFNEEDPVAFISIKENNKYTAEIYVMGVHPNYHRQGIGRALINKVIEFLKEDGYEFLQVKTLDESHPDIYYARTREFYLSVGFKPLESIPELWGEDNPCLIMVQYL